MKANVFAKKQITRSLVQSSGSANRKLTQHIHQGIRSGREDQVLQFSDAEMFSKFKSYVNKLTLKIIRGWLKKEKKILRT